MECPICCEEYNSSSKQCIKCYVCDGTASTTESEQKGEACRECWRRYLIESSKVPDCMHCHNNFTINFMMKNFTKGWLTKDYRKSEKKRLGEGDKAVIPEIMPEIEQEIKSLNRQNIWKNKQDVLNDMRCKLKVIRHNKSLAFNRKNKEKDKTVKAGIIKEWRGFLQEEKDTKIIVQDLVNDLKASHNEDYYETMETTQDSGVKVISKKYICPCPNFDENCRGLIDSGSYSCGICNTKVCKKCHSITTDEHVCNPDDVESIKMLKKNTKPCPSCATPIFKMSGCDQMWCTNCKTAFSWTKGEIENGSVHNPHYFEWMANNNGGEQNERRNVLDCNIDCDTTLIDIYNLNYRICAESTILKIYRFSQILHSSTRHINVNENDGRLTRLSRYVKGEIDDERLEHLAFLKFRSNSRIQTEYTIYQTFNMVAIPLINAFLIEFNVKHQDDDRYNRHTLKDKEISSKLFSELEELRIFCNNGLKEDMTYYGTSNFPQITDGWTIHGTSHIVAKYHWQEY